MERIKHAVEKAKQQLELRPGGLPAKATAPEPSTAISAITYSRTRVVSLDAAHLMKHRIIAFNKTDPLSVSFDVLRTKVMQKMDENGWRTLAVVSPVPECGKTVVAINLAMSIAKYADRTALLVDFDLRRPKVATYLGIRPVKSLCDVLEGDAEISEAFVNPTLPKLVVVPTSRPVQRSAEMLATRKVSELVKDLRDRYSERIVIFDLPPILDSDDAITLLPQIDCVLMVVGNGMVTKAEMDECMHHIDAASLLGIVLNKAEVQQRKYDS